MNKSFKVVFNRDRCALMVVNEVTSCVQAKGTKTVIAAAVAALAASGAMATEWVNLSSRPLVMSTASSRREPCAPSVA